jgi:hypothetical protein
MVKPPTDTAVIFPPKKQAAQQSGKKKSAGNSTPSDSCPGLAALLQSDMLNLIHFTKKSLNVKEIATNNYNSLPLPDITGYSSQVALIRGGTAPARLNTYRRSIGCPQTMQVY